MKVALSCGAMQAASENSIFWEPVGGGSVLRMMSDSPVLRLPPSAKVLRGLP